MIQEKLITALICGMTCLFILPAHSQNLKEWVKQKKTQKQYLIQQIAAQKIYVELMGQGVRLISSGWDEIQGLKKGELNLHRSFFKSFSRVNPRLKEFPKVLEIARFQLSIIGQYNQVQSLLNKADLLSLNEKNYLKKFYSNLLKRGLMLIKDLTSILEDDQLEMNDAQRIQKIERINKEMYEMLNASTFMLNDSTLLSQLKTQQKADQNLMEKMMGH